MVERWPLVEIHGIILYHSYPQRSMATSANIQYSLVARISVAAAIASRLFGNAFKSVKIFLRPGQKFHAQRNKCFIF